MYKQLAGISILATYLTLSSNIGFAAPLDDYSAGKTTVDITSYPNLNMTDNFTGYSSASNKADGKNSNIAWGATSGLGNGWAIQYRQFSPESQFVNDFFYFGVKSQEINVLHKINKNLSAFVGEHQTKYTYHNIINSNSSATNKNTLQVGLIGTKKLSPKTELYGIIGVGKDLIDSEVGLSYALSKNFDINLSYRYDKVKNLDNIYNNTSVYSDTVTSKGVGLGLTCKF